MPLKEITEGNSGENLWQTLREMSRNSSKEIYERNMKPNLFDQQRQSSVAMPKKAL